MNKTSGQYMDLIDPSSDVKVVDKENRVNQKPSETPAPEPNEKVLVDVDALQDSTSLEPPKIPETPETPEIDDDDAYESPFLRDIEVEKRPLGSSADNTRQLFGISSDAENQPIVAESEPTPAEPAESPVETIAQETLPEPEPSVAPPITIESTMIVPQYETSTVAPTIEPTPPFAHVSEAIDLAPAKKHLSAWIWVLIFIVITVVGIGAGVAAYLILGQ
ncbi:hypothetical protein FWH58_02530 [Candidatus Saccharibacteria bacterium]|nr:hypothetical protein [Candidatus Saccharibacteria bacterium]